MHNDYELHNKMCVVTWSIDTGGLQMMRKWARGASHFFAHVAVVQASCAL